jgi:beta-galactosidase GanA
VAQGVLPFDGWRDLPGFITLAHELGLLVLVRPGPYSCGGEGITPLGGGEGDPNGVELRR